MSLSLPFLQIACFDLSFKLSFYDYEVKEKRSGKRLATFVWEMEERRSDASGGRNGGEKCDETLSF